MPSSCPEVVFSSNLTVSPPTDYLEAILHETASQYSYDELLEQIFSRSFMQCSQRPRSHPTPSMQPTKGNSDL
jgi:hypothetical protein